MAKHLLTLVCLLSSIVYLTGQTLIHQEGFEGPDYSGYTTSTPFVVYSTNPDDDYFLRGQTPPNNNSCSPPCWTAISNFEGSNYILWEDFDGFVGGDGTITITLDPINILSYENMSISIGMAAPNTASLNRYEASDFIALEYQVDGGAWTRVHYASGGPEGSSGTAGRFRYDDDRNGVHSPSETLIATTMVYFSADLDVLAGTAITGSSINIRITAFSGVQEEMAIDDIQLLGTLNAQPPAITANPSPVSSCGNSIVNFSVTANNAVSYAWESSTDNVNFLSLNNGGIYSGTNTSTLTVNTNTSLNGYYYRCIVTGAASPAAISSSAQLTVDAGMPRLTMVDPINNLISITNCSNTCSVDLANYQLCGRFSYTAINAGQVVSGSLNLAPNATVTLLWNLAESSSDLGLYLPGGSFSNPAALVDWMQWQTAGNGRESVAVAKGIWTAGEYQVGAGPYLRNDCTLFGEAAWSGQPLADNTDDVCNSFTKNNVTGSGWYSVTDGAGNTILSLQPNGANLGNITVSIQEYTADTLGDLSGNAYLRRYLNIESSTFDGTGNPFPSPVGIRLFYPNQDLVDYNTATSNSYTIDQLNVIHYAGVNEDCDFLNNDYVGEIILPPSAKTYNGTEGFYLEFNASHFSEFASGEEPTLELELTSFNGNALENFNELQWATAFENGFSHFELERSNNGIDFRKLAHIVGQGNLGQGTFYNFIDESPYFGDNYYQLKIVQENGSYSYSDVVVLKSEHNSTIALYPNPVRDQLTLQFTTPTTAKVLLSIYSISGVKLREITLAPNEHEFTIDTQEILPGTYYMKVQEGDTSNSYKFSKF